MKNGDSVANKSGALVQNGWYDLNDNGSYVYVNQYILQSGWIHDNWNWYNFSPKNYLLCKNY